MRTTRQKMIRKIIFGVICLVGIIGIVLMGWGVYYEIRVPNAGIVRVLVGAAMVAFTGIAGIVVAKGEKPLSHPPHKS